jgi:hypothetical protein
MGNSMETFKEISHSAHRVHGEQASNENEIAEIIIDCAVKIHKEIGPGLLESVYEKILAYELLKRGLLWK